MSQAFIGPFAKTQQKKKPCRALNQSTTVPGESPTIASAPYKPVAPWPAGIQSQFKNRNHLCVIYITICPIKVRNSETYCSTKTQIEKLNRYREHWSGCNKIELVKRQIARVARVIKISPLPTVTLSDARGTAAVNHICKFRFWRLTAVRSMVRLAMPVAAPAWSDDKPPRHVEDSASRLTIHLCNSTSQFVFSTLLLLLLLHYFSLVRLVLFLYFHAGLCKLAWCRDRMQPD